jgi:hypothetical protein
MLNGPLGENVSCSRWDCAFMLLRGRVKAFLRRCIVDRPPLLGVYYGFRLGRNVRNRSKKNAQLPY